MDGRRCFIRMGGWTDDVKDWTNDKDGWMDDVVL